MVLLPFLLAACEADRRPSSTESPFSFELALTLPGGPGEIYDAMTGDISGWWDHKFSENPVRFSIDARPGGGFYEIFDESGDGVLHATVICAERGKLLRMEGPLGLSGKAVTMVYTLTFEARGEDSTQVNLSVHGAGEIDPGVPAIVQQVWEHFLVDQLKPYVESGKHLARAESGG
jgi:uncharacterized protein YndB with AHSA1/START domain